MNVVIILASGNGSRVKSSKIPKQFIEINNKPIVVHTIERFLTNKKIDLIVVACHPEWIDYLNNYITSHYKNTDKKYHIVEGGINRNESIANAVKYLKNISTNDNDIVLTHDAVRMFVSDRIINENIDLCRKHQAVDTVIPSIDTIVVSSDNNYIDDVPVRDNLYNGQTPQTFNFKILKSLYLNHKIPNTSDICKYLLDTTETKIALVRGESENFKITNDFDLKYAKIMVEKND